MWIGGFCVVGGAAHAAIFMVRDYTRLTITIIY
jgi:photosystem I P700 chlorophyll a apoprotein A1